jgi:hypothetical protein
MVVVCYCNKTNLARFKKTTKGKTSPGSVIFPAKTSEKNGYGVEIFQTKTLPQDEQF